MHRRRPGCRWSHRDLLSSSSFYEPLPTRADLDELGEHLATSVVWERRVVGGQSATTDILRRIDDGSRIALRRHGQWSVGFDDGIAHREHRVFEAVREAGVPTPAVLWSGAFGAATAIVTEFVDGNVIIAAENPVEWVDKLAETLASVHAVDVDAAVADVLIAAPPSRIDVAPQDLLRQHRDGERLLALRSTLAPDRSASIGLVHGDYWPGNVLWRDGSIVAVLDWEAAAIGDPARDVAYCATELRLLGFDAAADRFADTYERIAGECLPAMPYWIVSSLCSAIIDLPSYVDSWRGLGHEDDIEIVRARILSMIDSL